MNRKLSFFTEQRVFPYLGISDLDPKLFDKARKLMLGRQPQHPWANLPPEALLKVAGFARMDYSTGKPGYTLAAALMFGHDTTIQSIAPGYKFDALLRRRDTDRYDDRLIVRTNLIDAFDLLMGFVEKHLNDPFYMEGITSISLRSIIFRELVANIIAHREYTSAAPATMMIYRDRVEFKNPNVPHYHGRIEPGRFTPFPKNPTICKFMIQIGRYEELGSGVRKVNLYLPHYAPGAGKPVFDDGDMFTVTVPLGDRAGAAGQVAPTVAGQVGTNAVPSLSQVCPKSVPSAEAAKVLRAALAPVDLQTLMNEVGDTNRTRFRNAFMRPLIEAGLLEPTVPDKPRSSKQRYRLTAKGRAILEKST